MGSAHPSSNFWPIYTGIKFFDDDVEAASKTFNRLENPDVVFSYLEKTIENFHNSRDSFNQKMNYIYTFLIAAFAGACTAVYYGLEQQSNSFNKFLIFFATGYFLRKLAKISRNALVLTGSTYELYAASVLHSAVYHFAVGLYQHYWFDHVKRDLALVKKESNERITQNNWKKLVIEKVESKRKIII
jgi:hypothetical protein